MPPSARSDSDTRLTYDDLLLFPDDRKRREIIDGELFVTPSPTARHQVLLGRLHLAIGNYLAVHPGTGHVFLSPLDVVFSPHDVVEPDLLFVAGDQFEILTPKNVQGSPALVVEILRLAPARDEQTKRRLFSRTEVREYRIIDPDADLIKVSRRPPTARSGESWSSPPKTATRCVTAFARLRAGADRILRADVPATSRAV